MKTGFDIFNNNENTDDSYLNILSLLTVFMENSISNAAIYTEHSGRKIVTSYDISLALKREVFEFLNTDNLESRAKEILNEYTNELNIEDEEDEEDEEDDDDEDEEDDIDEYDDNNKKNNNLKKKLLNIKSIIKNF